MEQITKPHFSIPSIVAIVAAVVSFSVGPFWGFVLAILALVFGVIGVMLSMAPGIRGGIVSTISMVAGAIGIIVALIKALGLLFGRA